MRAAIERLRAEVGSDREAVARWLDDLAEVGLHSESDRRTCAEAAWALHHAYTGVEAILERTMRTIESDLPDGPDYHKAVLDAAALDIEGVRPPILGAETVSNLHDLRAFRHFVRHAYAVELDPQRLADLRRRALRLRPALEADLDALDGWLRELSKELEKG